MAVFCNYEIDSDAKRKEDIMMLYKKLNNGNQIPQLGYGVWKVTNEEASTAVESAIKRGYRLIDTATIYRNERGVGDALAKNIVPREDLFITTKVWNADQGYDQTIAAYNDSLEKLGLSYVDLYLIHWPTPKYDTYIETYKALEKLYRDGKVKAIGVCNFDIEHLERIMEECEVIPTVNQVEYHPYLQQKELREFCHKHDIQLEAYSPLMNGKTVLQDTEITTLAKKHNKTPAQIILRWHIQSDHIVIPKTVTPSRMEENLNVFDFNLTDSDMETISGLDRNERINAIPNEMHIR